MRQFLIFGGAALVGVLWIAFLGYLAGGNSMKGAVQALKEYGLFVGVLLVLCVLMLILALPFVLTA